MNVDNVRQLFLQDVVHRTKTGRSILYEWQAIADRYYLWKRLTQVSMLGSVVSLGFVINKRHTGRLNAYLIPFVGLVGMTLISKSYFKNYIEYVKQISNETDEKKIEKAMYFHKYSLLS
jgi:hypothetical protein